jgi:hypothetical protein
LIPFSTSAATPSEQHSSDGDHQTQRRGAGTGAASFALRAGLLGAVRAALLDRRRADGDRRFAAPDQRAVLVHGHAIPVGEAGLGGIERVVIRLAEVAPVILVEPRLDLAGGLTRRQAAHAGREADLEVGICPAARADRDELPGDVVAAARRPVAPEHLRANAIDGVPVAHRDAG